MSNQKITAIRRIQFCSGHRVMNHESKCATLHGHNYVMFIHAKAPGLDSIGRVIDFSELKIRCGEWIDKNWDHNMILFKDDIDTIELISICPRKKEPYILPMNPTAENMAKYFLTVVCPNLFKDTMIEIEKIVLWETENCYVEVSL